MNELYIAIDQCFLQENFVFPKLQRYIIAVNRRLLSMEACNFRTLVIAELSSSLSAFKELFWNVEKLYLENMWHPYKNIVPSIDEKGLNELTYLELSDCSSIECLIDTAGEKWLTTTALIFSNLEKLNIERMNCLKELWHGPPPIRFLQKLKYVYISRCYELKMVFPMNIGHIIAEKEISQTRLLLSNLTSLYLDSLLALESIWELQSNHQYNASLRSLELARIERCCELKSIFSTSVANSLSHLQQLEIYYCDELEHVFDFPQDVAKLRVRTSSLSIFPLVDFFRKLIFNIL